MKPAHCPGYEKFKHLSSFTCNCQNCGQEIEIFSDEFEKEHVCKNCGEKIDFTSCSIYGEGGEPIQVKGA